MTSPFSEGRFEYDKNHLYYLPGTVFSEMERPKPTFIVGARGSGKTTLLKALNWQQRLECRTLRRQLGNQPFRGLFVGTYVKLPKIQLGTFDAWLSDLDDVRHGQLLGFYLDLVFVELISAAVSEMLAQEHLTIPARVEIDAVSRWLDEHCEAYNLLHGSPPQTVSAFHEATVKLRLSLEHSARIREDVLSVLRRIPLGQVGSLSGSLAPKLAELCNHDTLGQATTWHFKVCMDEAECLTRFQQKVINTIIRLSEWPLFPVVSYVRRPDDMTSTLVPQLTHQKADRQLIVLDSMSRRDFIDLAEGVASVRCQEMLNDVSVTFNSRTTLGDLDINGLLQTLIDRSESPGKSALIDDALEFENNSTETPASLPFFEAYLAKKLDLAGQSPETRAERRHEASREYRKKFVAAFLSICHDLKVKQIPYASADMVLGISDNCVRDFLSQLDHLFLASGRTLADFLVARLPTDVQAKAIREASEEKRDSIPESGILSPVETGRVVKGLAMVTALLQATSKDGRHLRSTERGLFRLTAKIDEQTGLHAALSLVSDAADAGFLRLHPDDHDRHFRVHASLAPAYGFSYRGAYYPVALDLKDFEKLKAAKSEDELAKLARLISRVISGEDDSPLFPSEDAEYGN